MLKCVSHMDMDAGLQTEQFDAALAHLSDPSFVFEKVNKGFRSKVSMCRLSKKNCMLHFIFSSLCFTLLFYVSGVVLKRVQIIPELLVAGNPPSSITAAIVSFVQNITTYVVIKELPSIFLIYRFRTVLLITCQLLAAYSLSKSEK